MLNFENKKSSCVIRNTRTSQKPFSALVFLRFFTKIFYSLGFLLEFFMIYIESLLPTVDFLCIDFFIRAFDNKFFQKGIYRAFKMLEKAFFVFLSEIADFWKMLSSFYRIFKKKFVPRQK